MSEQAGNKQVDATAFLIPVQFFLNPVEHFSMLERRLNGWRIVIQHQKGFYRDDKANWFSAASKIRQIQIIGQRIPNHINA